MKHRTLDERIGARRFACFKGESYELPDEAQLETWFYDSVCEAVDGCMVEHDGTCPHGARSWFLSLGMI